jgi:hypothetical protein
MDEARLASIRAAAVHDAMRLWDRMTDPSDPLPLDHDGYLKLWAMLRPTLPADSVLLDEAQDTNPVVLEMLRHQPAQIVYVGDRHQQIYEWRGAVNAMERILTPHESHLTTSFRFGESIAGAASSVLARLGETRPLVGNAAVTSHLGSDTAEAIVARTNASVISAVLREMASGRLPHVIGGTSKLIRMLKGVEDLKRNQPSEVSEFFGFEAWGEVVEHSKTPEGKNLRTVVTLVENHGEEKLIRKLNQTAQDEHAADVVVSTAHKAKGREWDTVSLADDFLPPQPNENKDAPPTFDPAEIRLFYVALARAPIAVEVSPVALSHFDIQSGSRYAAPEKPKPIATAPTQPAGLSNPASPTPMAPSVTAPTPAEAGGSGLLAFIGRWIWIPIGLGVLKLLFG